MGGTKITASSGGIKISELGKELNVDPREIVAAAKEMTMENAKVPASWVTPGQADRLRAKFGGNKDLKAQLERKRVYLETGALPEDPQTAAESALKSQPVQLGARTYEKDRRSVFGVVVTAGGFNVERPLPHAPKHASPAQAAAVENSSPAAADAQFEQSAASIPMTPAPVPKKFLQVQVAPPVRRAGEHSDTRFGVVVPAPEAQKSTPAPASGLWDKLNDGRTMPSMPELQTQPIEQHQAPEQSATAAEPAAAKVEIAAENTIVVETAIPTVAAPMEVAELPLQEFVPPPPKIHEVPVKREPSHRAFGAKLKVKAKKSKLLDQVKPEKSETQQRRDTEPKHPREPKRQSERSTRAVERHQPQPDGLLKRLVKTIFKK